MPPKRQPTTAKAAATTNNQSVSGSSSLFVGGVVKAAAATATTTATRKPKVLAVAAAADAIVAPKPRKAAVATASASAAASTEVTTMATTEKEQYIMDKYKKKENIQHVLDLPDTYIGSIDITEKEMHIFDDSTNKIIYKKIQYIPGLYKLYDEVIVNARDHILRMIDEITSGRRPHGKYVTYIDIQITDDGTIIVTNDGNGVDVCMHKEHNVWVPELIFAHFLTGANFDQNKDSNNMIGGKNGMGTKLAFIWSTYASVDIIDHEECKHYFQEFHNNLSIIDPPQINALSKSAAAKPHTRITFRPDYARLGIAHEGLSADLRALFKKRAYDIAGLGDGNRPIKITFNGEPIVVKNFQQYLDYYVGNKQECERIYESGGDHWEYAVALSPTEKFQQVSFVNGIATSKGGTHVNYILGQITNKLVELIKKRRKVTVSPATIREQIILFVRSDIVKPAFDSQTKENLTTNVKKFGSECEVSDKFIEKLASPKMGIIDTACAVSNAREVRSLTKATDGSKKRRIYGIPALEDAEHAGGPKSINSILILTEGESAKEGVKSGLKGLPEGESDYIGVYPLKGKVLNCRNESPQTIAKNKEIVELKQIMGLQDGVVYDDSNIGTLRYGGGIVLLTDSDMDGSHIKGLIINLFHALWPSLAQRPGFLKFMNTPILKATKGHQKMTFYNQGEYNGWVAQNQHNYKSWTIKYYKGLGTSTAAEWKEYFRNKRFINYLYTGMNSDTHINMAFNKKNVDDRKAFLENYDRELYLNTSAEQVTFEDFINYELIHFSHYDNIRSIPSLVDGLKPSQRKVLFAAFKRNLVEEMKVAQFAGYIAEHTGYHHGEVSLQNCIIGMAQNFMGSNNINLLSPEGQFGTRGQGGDDSASPRYIFTKLMQITRTLFPKPDDDVLDYLTEDGKPIEPLYYIPIIPMILVNGSVGIGTGWSTNIPCFNPIQIVNYIKAKLQGGTAHASVPLIPYYEGFEGTITPIEQTPHKYLVCGKYEKINKDSIIVKELPVGYWTSKFKEHMEWLEYGIQKDIKEAKASKEAKDQRKVEKLNDSAGLVKYFKLAKSDVDVDCIVEFYPGVLDKLEAEMDPNSTDAIALNGVHRLLNLYSTISTSNMHMFNANDKLVKYDSPEAIIDEFYSVRLDCYERRRVSLINKYERELVKLSNRVKFINETLNGSVDLRRKSESAIEGLLTTRGYAKLDDSYNYLTDMKMISVSEERVRQMRNEHDEKQHDLDVVRRTSAPEYWLQELDAFHNEYVSYVIERKRQLYGELVEGQGSGAAKASTTTKRKPASAPPAAAPRGKGKK